MRAIIPAAGLGTRLMPLTSSRPKGMVEICGQSLLARSLGQLHDAGVEEVVCVSGHLADRLEAGLRACEKRPRLRFVRNERYATTNSIVSLALTIPLWEEEFCVIDSDVCFGDELLARLLAADGDAVAVDTGKPVEQIDMRVELRDGYLFHMDKQLSPASVGGEFFGLSRWTREGGERLAEEIRILIDEGREDVWYEWAIRAVAKRRPIAVVPASTREWAEIDAPEDLQAAEAVVRSSARSTK
jgi:L-glutamine-phosphate cytidylyltransferase